MVVGIASAWHAPRVWLAATLAGRLRARGGGVGSGRGWGLGLAEPRFARWGGSPLAARWAQRLFPRFARAARRHWGRLFARLLGGQGASAIRAVRPGMVEQPTAVHGAGAGGSQRPAFPDRLGIIRGQRVFPDHQRTASARGARRRLALSGGVARGNAVPVAFFAALAAHTGSWELGPMRDRLGSGAAVLAGAGRVSG